MSRSPLVLRSVLDSGKLHESSNYTTVVLIHGLMWQGSEAILSDCFDPQSSLLICFDLISGLQKAAPFLRTEQFTRRCTQSARLSWL